MRYGALGFLLMALSSGAAHAQGTGEPQAYYTEAQATRGEALFKKHCGSCHFAEPDPEKAKLETAGYVLGKVKTTSNLGGTYIVRGQNNGRRIFTTVYYLFRELESMPAATDSISQQARTDIMTYLLRQNRFPAGRTELRYDTAAMRMMPLDEPGFVSLFNGKDFSGWKFLVGLGCAPPPDGCGRTTPGNAFAIRNGILHGSGKEHGIAYTEGKYKDFTLRVDQLSEVPTDWEGDDDTYYYANAGFHLFLMDQNLFVWPKSMTLRGEQRDLLSAVPCCGVGAKVKASTWDRDALRRVVRPLGQWNSIEIVSKAGDIKAYVNDTLVSTVTQHEFGDRAGHIGLQMQGFPMRWRNLRIKAD